MIEAVYISPSKASAMQEQQQIEVRAGLGIVGDRYFGRNKEPGQNITFIESESIDHYNATNDQAIKKSATRRNIVTKGIRLNDLVGKSFKVGGVTFLGIELCEPCKSLGNDLANESISAPLVVKAFVKSGGLRADVLNDGNIAVGMRFDISDA